MKTMSAIKFKLSIPFSNRKTSILLKGKNLSLRKRNWSKIMRNMKVTEEKTIYFQKIRLLKFPLILHPCSKNLIKLKFRMIRKSVLKKFPPTKKLLPTSKPEQKIRNIPPTKIL